MLQVHPVYSLCNRRKTVTGSPDPTHAKGTNKPCISSPLYTPQGAALCHKKSCLAVNHDNIHLLQIQIMVITDLTGYVISPLNNTCIPYR